MRKLIALFLWLALGPHAARAADITIALSAAPSSADPYFHNVGPNNALAHMLFDGLTRTDPQIRLEPDLAASWTTPDDNTWRFALVPDISFADGSPFTAEDVVFSLCRARTGVGPTHSFTAVPKEIDRIEIPDPHSIVLHTITPDPELARRLAGLAILSSHSAGVSAIDFAAEDCGVPNLPQNSDFDGGRMANGTGAYRLERYTSGDIIRLARNPHHHGEAARWDHVTLKPVLSVGPRLAGLIAGDFDMVENPSALDLPVLKAHGGFAWTITPSDRLIFLQPDIGRESSPLARGRDGSNPLRDPHVRQAISLAIDRKAITTRLMAGQGEAADQFLASGLFGALPDPPEQKYDPAAARALLAEAGHADDIRLTLTATKDRYIDDAQVAEAIGQYLTRIGIHVTIEALPQTVFFPQRTKRMYSLAMGGWGFSEASDLFRTFVVSTMPDLGLGGSNYGGYHSEDFDRLVLAALQDMDETRRRRELEDATRIALHDNALIPLYWETTIWAYKDRFDYVGRADQMTDPDGLRMKGK